MTQTQDAINPSHYKSHPSGLEAIEIIENYMVNLGNAIKYLWRLGQKDASAQELNKARWYVRRETKYLNETQQGAHYKVSYVNPITKGLTLGLIERYLSFEPEGTLRDAKELIMRAPFYVQSLDALEVADNLLARLIDEINLKEFKSA